MARITFAKNGKKFLHHNCVWFQQGSRLNERANAAGFPSLNENRICSNTIKSHRLVRFVSLVYGFEKSEQLFELLNYEHFINGKKLNDTEFLIKCCERIGLDIPTTRMHLSSDEGRADVLNTIQELKQMQVTSIPIFIVNSYWGIEGAVSANKFMIIFRDIESHIVSLEQQGRYAEINEKGPMLFAGLLGIGLAPSPENELNREESEDSAYSPHEEEEEEGEDEITLIRGLERDPEAEPQLKQPRQDKITEQVM